MKQLGKRGTHVGIVISFNIFILFLLSIFLLVTPFLKERGEKQQILSSLYQNLWDNVSSNMTLTLIKISDGYTPSGKNCIELSGGGWLLGENIVIKNMLNRRLASNSNIPLNINWTGDKFLKIYSSLENFEPLALSSNDCAIPIEDSNFFIEHVKTEKYIFESNLIELNASYKENYGELKTYLGILPKEEFGFSFINSQGATEIEVGRIPSSASVYSKENHIIYIDNESKILPGIIVVKVW